MDRPLSRRTFLAGASVTATGSVLAACGGGTSSTTPSPAPTPTPTPAPAYTDADYINFILNLEYLEAEFYIRAAVGGGLSAGDSGNVSSKTTGGLPVPSLSVAQGLYLNELAQNELDHVRLLRSVLGSGAVAAPAIDLTNSFRAIAQAAGLGSTFNPFDSFSDFLLGAFLLEDLGVSAYRGALKLLNTTTYLASLSRIQATEAYHAASIRCQIVIYDAGRQNNSLTDNAVALQKLRANLGGAAESDLSPTTISNTDPKTSLVYERSTDQVLHVLYGTGNGAGVKGGAFFPGGFNGAITQTYS